MFQDTKELYSIAMNNAAHPLLSTEPQIVAHYLVECMARQFDAKHASPQDLEHGMGNKLLKLRNAIWQNAATDYDPQRKRAQRAVYSEIIVDLQNDEVRGAFMKLVAQMSHLRQLANMVARDNFFAAYYAKEAGALIPGSPAFFIEQSGSGAQLILHAVNAAVFNPVFTAHPTNNSALASMQAMGEISKAIAALQKLRAGLDPDALNIQLQAVERGIADYLDTSLTPQNARGEDENLNAVDETRNVLHFMGEIYRELPNTLAEFDAAFEKKFRLDPASPPYDPLTLHPRYRFDSWGSSGDKDGNAKINATTTLQALIQHRRCGLALYFQDAKNIELGCVDGIDWAASLGKALHDVEALDAQLTTAIADQEDANACELGLLPDAAFDRISARLQANFRAMDFNAFEQALVGRCRNLSDHAAGMTQLGKITLDLLRNVRIFGASFGRIEYRETAVEFTHAVAYLLRHAAPSIDYPGTLPEERIRDADDATTRASKRAVLQAKEKRRIEILGDLLRRENASHLRALLHGQWQALIRAGAGKAYAQSEAAIVYQSIKRMQLARDFPQSIAMQVLAECETPSHVLEAKLLMEIVGEEKGAPHPAGDRQESRVRRPVMGIVPLFEDPRILREVGARMCAILTNPAYVQHLEDFLDAHPEARVIDPATGHEARDTVNPARKHRPPLVQEVQLAHSDNSRRGGLAAARAYLYDAHRILDALGNELGMTIHKFEGGSFSDPFRNGVRAVVGMIKEYGLSDYFKATMQGGDLPNYFTHAANITRFLGGVLAFCARGLLRNERRLRHGDDASARNSDDLTLPALKGTYRDHRPSFTQPEKIGAMTAVLQGPDPAALFKRSIATRANRQGVVFKHSESQTFGDVLWLDPDEVRTIVYSEIPQHNQISPSLFGSYNLAKRLSAIYAIPNVVADLENGTHAVRSEALRRIDMAMRGMAATPNGNCLIPLGGKPPNDFENHTIASFDRIFEGCQSIENVDWRYYLEANNLSAKDIRHLYESSTPFRDEMDKMAYGLLMTDMEAAMFHHPEFRNRHHAAGHYFQTEKLPEYMIAACMVHAALTGKNLDLPSLAKETAEDDTHSLLMQEGLLEHTRHAMLRIEKLRPVQQGVEGNMALLDFQNSMQSDLRARDLVAQHALLHKLRVKGRLLFVDEDGQKNVDVPGIDLGPRAADLAQSLKLNSLRHVETYIDAETRRTMLRIKAQAGAAKAQYDEHYAISHAAWVALDDRLRPPFRATRHDEQAREHLISVMVDLARGATHAPDPMLSDRPYYRARLAADARLRKSAASADAHSGA